MAAGVRFQSQRQQRRRRRSYLLFVISLVMIFLVFVWTLAWSIASVATIESSSSSDKTLGEWRVHPFSKVHFSDALTSLLPSQHRNYTTSPITAEESNILTQQDKSGIKAAVCHRTLFGDRITLDPMFAFVSYYRLLGFDHIFFWYRPNIAKLARFDELSSLPYVTMTPYTGEGNNEGQYIVEFECLSNSTFAANYDWALNIDADEYLWFNSHMSVKEFLSMYNSDYNFLSFGKWMYTLLHGVKVEEDSGFGLDSYTFTAKSHCNHQFHLPELSNYIPRNRTYTYCPSFQGRSKILAKPKYHKRVKIHGMGIDLKKVGRMHFETSVAHFKEWRGILLEQRKGVNYRPPVNFNASFEKEVDIVDFSRAHERVDKKIVMHYDSKLQEWMRFIASGCQR